MTQETALAEIGLQPHIPLDKSWLMRMGVLDLIYDQSDTANFLRQQTKLSDDLKALRAASEAWPNDEPIPVGESGTLYRFLSFVAWEADIDKEFITEGTLTERAITQDPSIIDLSQRELLKLDSGTSQWASAAVLCGDPERLETPPHKLALTYDAVQDWHRQQGQNIPWLPRRDTTIARQADAFNKLCRGEPPTFNALQPEDYCFAVEFGYLRPETGQQQWPSLQGHESNRPAEMAAAMDQAGTGEVVTSRDHRVVQAIAMWGRFMEREVEFAHPEAVSKSWPEFWDFLESTKS